MANFFKEYHAERKAKEAAAEAAKKAALNPTIEYEQGQMVRIDPMYDENRNGKRYFVTYLGDDCVLLAKTKKEAMSGYGHIYSIHTIVNK